MTSVFSRLSELSHELTMSRGVMPSPSRTHGMPRDGPATFVASTIFCRMPGFRSSQRPMIVSVAPYVSLRAGTAYISAVSMKLMPRSTAWLRMPCADASSTCSPKVIVPRQIGVTRRSLFPNWTLCICLTAGALRESEHLSHAGGAIDRHPQGRSRALPAVRQLPHQRQQELDDTAPVARIRQRRVESLRVLRPLHRRAARPAVRLARGRDVGPVGPEARAVTHPSAAGHARLRRTAGPGHLRRRRQHHQERGAVPHPRASAVDHRRNARREATRTGEGGAAVQLRLLRVEEAVRAEEALAGAHEAHVPAVRRAAAEGASGTHAAQKLLVRAVPGEVRLIWAARSEYADPCHAGLD